MVSERHGVTEDFLLGGGGGVELGGDLALAKDEEPVGEGDDFREFG
jgi:hypothetical protein